MIHFFLAALIFAIALLFLGFITWVVLAMFCPCRFGAHIWSWRFYVIGHSGPGNGKEIERAERHCTLCPEKQIILHGIQDADKRQVYDKMGKRKYYTYRDGDWLDIETKSYLMKNI